MRGKVLVGTIRGERDGKHVVVGRDGSVTDVIFEGDVVPRRGGDVIGRISYNKFGEATMSLRPTLLDALIEGDVKITMVGSRPDLTARALAKLLARSKSAMISPGKGSSMERMTQTDDPDLAWAMGAFKPEADRLGIALNVIDVQKLARSIWENSKLRDGSLPADIEGNRRSMNDLVKLLRSGFHPECSRMVENYTGKREISVNFVLPYSPFNGASGFARTASFMDNGVMPITTMTVSEARRLSSARTMALALAHNKLLGGGLQADVMQSRRAAHLANCFADSAAVLTFLASGGRREVAEEYADLKESSLFFGLDQTEDIANDGVLVESTHKAIRKALGSDLGEGADIKDIVALSARLAKRYALPAARFNAEKDAVLPDEITSAVEAANRVGADLRGSDYEARQACGEIYRSELRTLVDEHSGNKVSAQRLITFGRLNVPHGMREIFIEETAGLIPSQEDAPMNSLDLFGGKAKLVDRLRMAKASASANDGLIEFAEPRVP